MIQYLLRAKHFVPDVFETSVFDVDFQSKYNDGKRVLITDLDNTLISYEDEKPTKEVLDLFEKLENIGFRIIILSNNVSQRLNAFTEEIDIEGHANARKPLLSTIKTITNEINLDEVVLMGDQLMTDIWCANRLGVTSILVNPIKRKTEKWYTRFNRKIEQGMLKRIKNKFPDKYQSLGLNERR